MRLRPGTPHFEKAVTTVNGPALSRPKRYSRLDCAQGAFYRHFNTLSGQCLGVSNHADSNPLILPCFAGFTSFGLVLKSLVCKEQLLACAENELITAVDAP